MRYRQSRAQETIARIATALKRGAEITIKLDPVAGGLVVHGDVYSTDFNHVPDKAVLDALYNAIDQMSMEVYRKRKEYDERQANSGNSNSVTFSTE